MSRILKLYERSIEQKGQSDEEFELSKAIFKREQERLNVQICKRSDGSLFTRKLKRKLDATCHCSVCGSEYKLSSGKQYSHNYGGIPKKRSVCSSECLNVVSKLIGIRMSDACANLF